MGWIEVIALALKVFDEVWTNRTDPAQARIRAAAVATRDLHDDQDAFDKELADNDLLAISARLATLHARVQSEATNRAGQPASEAK